MSRADIEAGRASVKIFSDESDLIRGLKKSQRMLRAFGRNAQQMGRTLTGAFVAAAVPIGFAIKTFASFSDAMLFAKGTSGALGQQFADMNTEARRLGSTTSFTASEVAGLMGVLGQANFSPEEIVEASSAILDLARATKVDLGFAGNFAAKVKSAFGLAASDMTKVSDTLAAATNRSNQDITELMEGFKLASPFASQLGDDIDTLAGLLGVLANSSISASQASTMLQRGYKNLIDPRIRKEVEKFTGISIQDPDTGKFRGMVAVLEDIATAGEGMDDVDFAGKMDEFFGRGAAGALILTKNIGSVREKIAEVGGAAGAAAELAALMDSEVGGAMRRFASAWKDLQIGFVQQMGDELEEMLEQGRNALNWIGIFLSQNKGLSLTILKTVAAIGIAGVSLIAFGSMAMSAASLLGVFIISLKLIAATVGILISALTFLVSPLGIFLTAGVGVLALIGHITGLSTAIGSILSESVVSMGKTFGQVMTGVMDAISNGNMQAAMAVMWGGAYLEWIKGKNKLLEIWTVMTGELDKLWETFKGGIVDSILATFEGVVGFAKGFKSAFMSVFGWISDAFETMMISLTAAFHGSLLEFRKAKQEALWLSTESVNDDIYQNQRGKSDDIHDLKARRKAKQVLPIIDEAVKATTAPGATDAEKAEAIAEAGRQMDDLFGSGHEFAEQHTAALHTMADALAANPLERATPRTENAIIVEEKLDEIDQGVQDKLSAQADELAAAQNEFNRLLQEAKKPKPENVPEDDGGDDEPPTPPPPEPTPEAAGRRLGKQSIDRAVGDVAGVSINTQEGFSAVAKALSTGAEEWAPQTAENTKATAIAAKKMARLMSQPGFEFVPLNL